MEVFSRPESGLPDIHLFNRPGGRKIPPGLFLRQKMTLEHFVIKF